MNRQQLKNLLRLAVPILAAFVISQIAVGTLLTNPQAITRWLAGFGPYVILAYVFLQAVTVIIAPVGGLFLYISVLALFGDLGGLLLMYITTAPLYCVNFYLARRFGRPLVLKIVGQETLEQIDHYAKDIGMSTLIILRVFQSSIFDYLAYAVGLTQISFKTFLIIDILGGVPGVLISYLVLRSFKSFTAGIIAVLITGYLLIGLSIVLNHLLQKHQKITG